MEVISFVPGRVRLKLDIIYKNNELSDALQLYFRELIGITGVKVNPVIGTISLKYNPNIIDVNTLKNRMISMVDNNGKHLKYISEHYNDYLKEEKNLQVAKKKIFIFGSIYILYKIKQHFWGKFFIGSSLPVLKVAALVTLIKGYPQLKRNYNKIAEYFPTNPDKLLLLAGTALTLSREGNKGTMLLFLKALTDALQSYSKLQIKRTLIENTGNPNSVIWYNYKGTEYLLPIKFLEEGDVVTFYENESIIVDGVIIEGNALINYLYYSGQPEIKRAKVNSCVYDGMVVVSGYIKVRVKKIPDKSLKSDLLLSSLNISKRVKFYQERSLYFASTLALASFIITGNSLTPLSVLLLMTPSASKVALNAGLANYLKLLMKNKILLRNINTIEKILNANSIVFDKTGTLTRGKLRIGKIEIYDDKYTPEDIVQIAASCEGNICHPVASAFTTERMDNLDFNNETIYIPSKGIISNYQKHRVVIGNDKLMMKEKISIVNPKIIKDKEVHFYIPIYFAVDHKLRAKILLIEDLEETAPEMIKQVKELGIEDLSVISGDIKRNTQNIANKLDIQSYMGGLSLDDKVEFIKDKKRNKTVVMIGDGINDTLAMEEADISISFVNAASQHTLLKSDCLLMVKDLSLVPRLIQITEKSYYRIQRNIDFSQNYNFVFGLMATFGYVGPFKAKSLNTFNSILSIFNSMRISSEAIKNNQEYKRGDL
ncbi:HAD-IC family P-type ATPase [Alkaliphilus serpentinus]|uniref:Cd(2+)-exporting ATPase n=1 Tax=Alkaliphilus serpentinus TaxID=1482731 RepID=A0A833HLZ9_9FIRM|nr:HAD-IC family P-type ATPase [Alkaliphilus serpentinus]KAB3525585.1 HAD-IC family P-type ATPase [Alkaliphilus serpentinus]